MQRFLFVLATLTALATAAFGQFDKGLDFGGGFGGGGGDHAEARVFHRVDEGRARVVIKIAIDHDWHLYHTELGPGVGKPTRLTISGANFELEATRWPEPERIDQPGLGAGGSDTYVLGHHGEILVYALGKASGSLDGLTVELNGLTCQEDGSCVLLGTEVESEGPGDDALFAAFPADLVAGSGGAESGSGATDATPATSAGEETSASDAAALAAVEFPGFEPQSDAGSHSLAMWLLLAFVAGMILESLPVTIILAPILAPIAASVGVDPVHFSVIFLVGASIGFITPPYGLNLYVASGVTGVPYFKLLRYTVPYLVALISVWFLVAMTPSLALMLLPAR